MKNKGYTLYLFYNDTQIGKYKMIGDDFNKLYKSFGERILRRNLNLWTSQGVLSIKLPTNSC